jgi:hypothetical protein
MYSLLRKYIFLIFWIVLCKFFYYSTALLLLFIIIISVLISVMSRWRNELLVLFSVWYCLHCFTMIKLLFSNCHSNINQSAIIAIIFLSISLSLTHYQKNKVTEKFKRPFKKRHSSIYHQPSNRVNKFLSQAIEARSVDREKTAHVKLISLKFRESEKEKSYHQDFDYGFTMSMGTSLLLLILSAGLQVRFNL